MHMAGIRMSTASHNGHPVIAAEIERKQNSYQCDSCGVEVSFVRRHIVRNDDPKLRRVVQAFFRLSRDTNHHLGCRYTPSGQVDEIVAQADAVEDGGENPFENHGPNEPVEFRLNIATDAQRQIIPPEEGQIPTEEYRERVARLWNGETLANYCRSATGLAKIWREMESNKGRNELRDLVSFTHLGEQLNWDDFFFGIERYPHLRKHVLNGELVSPVAALVHIRSIDGALRFINCTPMRNPWTKEDTRIGAQINGATHLLQQFEADCHYIVFGNFYSKQPSEWAVPGTEHIIRYQNLGISIHNTAQFCKVDNPDDPDDQEA